MIRLLQHGKHRWAAPILDAEVRPPGGTITASASEQDLPLERLVTAFFSFFLFFLLLSSLLFPFLPFFDPSFSAITRAGEARGLGDIACRVADNPSVSNKL